MSTQDLSIARRRFLLGSLSLASYFALAPYSYASALQNPSQNLQLAAFLTGKMIHPDVSTRAFKALSTLNPEFQSQANALAHYIQAESFTSIDHLKNDPLFQQKFKATALDIISVFYLGYAGTPQYKSASDDVIFVTFTEIETFKLTRDYTPIPGYSNLKTNYWVSLPSA